MCVLASVISSASLVLVTNHVFTIFEPCEIEVGEMTVEMNSEHFPDAYGDAAFVESEKQSHLMLETLLVRPLQPESK